MRDTLAFEILSNIMSANEDWRCDSPVPSTSQDGVDPVIRLDGSEPLIDPTYEETIQSLYSEDSVSDPLWGASSTTLSPPPEDDIDFLSDSAFLDSSMTEVVKVELKTHIQAKRRSTGQEEITVEFKQQQSEPEEALSEEERLLRMERKEKNRLAAQKCRNKKRERADILENDISRLENRQDNLKEEIRRLQDEHEHLKEVIEIHGVVCPKIRKLGDS